MKSLHQKVQDEITWEGGTLSFLSLPALRPIAAGSLSLLISAILLPLPSVFCFLLLSIFYPQINLEPPVPVSTHQTPPVVSLTYRRSLLVVVVTVSTSKEFYQEE
ncbi:hypothetical protein L1049_026680 [Liquidambar formosana]|uniref:Uncharacterized protein n=1 Tax=Liquidambar formosana TaxID=63359 RepID=A0AAP0NF82_LIQFO